MWAAYLLGRNTRGLTMFRLRYVISCNECSTEYEFKSGKAARAYFNACNSKCLRCGERLDLWTPLFPTTITPPPEMKMTKRDIKTIRMW